MKYFGILISLFVMNSCHTNNHEQADFSHTSPVLIPDIEYKIGEVFYDRAHGLWLFQADSSKVSGHIITHFVNSSVAQEFSVIDGKKQGIQSTYFPNGQLKFSESFNDNKLNGSVKRWSQKNGYQLLAHLTYSKGKLNGEQKKWYNTGELHKLMNLNMGKEEGLQRAYRKNGALYANYEARLGRIFGLKRSNLCYELDNEQVVYKQ